MATDQNLPAYKEKLLFLTARMLILAENASILLYEHGLETQEGEPRALLSKVVDLNKEIRTNLTVIFEGIEVEEDEAIKRLRGG